MFIHLFPGYFDTLEEKPLPRAIILTHERGCGSRIKVEKCSFITETQYENVSKERKHN